MAMDWYWLAEKTEPPLLSLGERELETIQPVLNLLQQKTGILVDPYGTTRLSPDHAKIMLHPLTLLSKDKSLARMAANLIKILSLAAAENKWLLIEGD